MYMAVCIRDCKTVGKNWKSFENCVSRIDDDGVIRSYVNSPILREGSEGKDVRRCEDCDEPFKRCDFLAHKQNCTVDINRNFNPNYEEPLRNKTQQLKTVDRNSNYSGVFGCTLTCCGGRLNSPERPMVSEDSSKYNVTIKVPRVDIERLPEIRKPPAVETRIPRIDIQRLPSPVKSVETKVPRVHIERLSEIKVKKLSPKFKCPHANCNKLFCSANRLQRHRRLFHPGLNQIPRNYLKKLPAQYRVLSINCERLSLKFKCRRGGCNKPFHTEERLRRHRRLCHPAKCIVERCVKPVDGPFQCYHDKCQKSFRSAERLQRHRRQVHPPVIKCPRKGCRKRMKLTYLSKHIFFVHGKPKTFCYSCNRNVLLSTFHHHAKKCNTS